MIDVADPELLSRAQVALLIERSVGRIDQLAQTGRLGYVQTPVGRLFRRAEAEAYKATRSTSSSTSVALNAE